MKDKHDHYSSSKNCSQQVPREEMWEQENPVVSEHFLEYFPALQKFVQC